MISWDQSIEINASIENIWALLQSEEKQRIMPQVVHTKLLEADEVNNVFTYEQTYQEGKRQESYLLTEQILINTDNKKTKNFEFTISDVIHTNATFSLTKLSNNKTVFHYKGTNTGKSFLGKMMLKMASNTRNDKTVQDFLLLVKSESEKNR